MSPKTGLKKSTAWGTTYLWAVDLFVFRVMWPLRYFILLIASFAVGACIYGFSGWMPPASSTPHGLWIVCIIGVPVSAWLLSRQLVNHDTLEEPPLLTHPY